MTKRSNPYLDDFVPQSKTHVGIKQFNNNEQRMQKVYEKTLQLLFKGAKNSPREGGKTLEIESLSRKNCMKQLQINRDGTLGYSAIVKSGKQCTVAECVCGSRLVDAHCCYCEAPLCSSCNKLCTRCLLTFCSKCCLLGSECTEICVSCYG